MRRFLAVLSVLGGLACSDIITPGAPVPQPSIRDAVHEGGNSHFYFLPPLVASPEVGGVFDGTHDARVRICEWNGLACLLDVAAFSAAGGTGGEAVRVDPVAEHYIVNWHTDASNLDPLRIYRIFVMVAGTVLGHADVDVVATGRELRNVNTGAFIGLVNGRTLPIRFRIEVGAVFVAGPGASAISAAGGSVSLLLPAGALAAPVGITVEPAAAVPADVRIIAGSGYEFGPDGLVFQQPVMLSVRYDPAAIDPGVAESSLRLHKVVNGGLVEVAGSTVDTDANTVSGLISGFSTYVAAQGGSVAFNTSLASGASAIWASGPGDVFAVGRGGLIRHFDGSTWSVMSSNTTLDLEAVWGSGPGNVYAAGDGLILRYDGSTWNAVLDNVRVTGPSCRIAAGDLNGDGRGDVVQANHGSEGGDILILLNTGSGAFNQHATIPGAIAIGTCLLQLALLDDDAHLDLVYQTSSGFVIRRGDGAGGFGLPAAHAVAIAADLAPADVNADGKRDLVVPIWSETAPFVGVMLGDGTGTFASPFLTSLPVGSGILDLAAADMNGDGAADVALVRENASHVLAALATSGGALGPWTQHPLAGGPRSLALTDVTGDLKVDLVVARTLGDGASGSIAIADGDGAGGFGGFMEHAAGPVPHSLVVADLNGDVIPDLVTTDMLNVFVALGAGGGSFAPVATYANPLDCTGGQGCLAVAEVTGDGRPDLLSSRNSAGFVVLPNLGGGTFQPAPFFEGIWGSSASNVYAVGGGTIMRYDGTGWSISRASPSVFDGHRCVWGASASAVFVCNGDRIVRFDGVSWTESAPLGPFSAGGIWGFGPSDVVVAGAGGMFRFDGAAWSPVAIPDPPSLDVNVDWNGVWGFSPADLYLVGGGGGAGRIAYFNGAAWLWLLAPDEGPLDMLAVWGTSSNDIWVAGRSEILRGSR